MKEEITEAAAGILRTLYDPRTGKRYWSNLRHGLHSCAAGLVRNGWIVKHDRGIYRPIYEITDAGIPMAEQAWEKKCP